MSKFNIDQHRKAGEATAPVTPSPDALLREAREHIIRESAHLRSFAEGSDDATSETWAVLHCASEIVSSIDDHLKAGGE